LVYERQEFIVVIDILLFVEELGGKYKTNRPTGKILKRAPNISAYV
jgi:hypothetical protein